MTWWASSLWRRSHRHEPGVATRSSSGPPALCRRRRSSTRPPRLTATMARVWMSRTSRFEGSRQRGGCKVLPTLQGLIRTDSTRSTRVLPSPVRQRGAGVLAYLHPHPQSHPLGCRYLPHRGCEDRRGEWLGTRHILWDRASRKGPWEGQTRYGRRSDRPSRFLGRFGRQGASARSEQPPAHWQGRHADNRGYSTQAHPDRSLRPRSASVVAFQGVMDL